MIETFKYRNKKLMFFGSAHGSSVRQANAIQKAIVAFKPAIILVESGWHHARPRTRKESLAQGEMAFTVYLARKLGIEVESNDPSYPYNTKKIARMTHKYGKERTFVFYMLRGLLYTRGNIKLENYFDNVAGYFYHDTKWNKFEYTLGNFKELFRKHLKEKFDPKKPYFDYEDPTLDINILNEMTRDEDIMRDRYMLQKIRQLLKTHDRIFVIKGSGHLFSQRRKLKRMFERLRV